jgi:hypothetical protein
MAFTFVPGILMLRLVSPSDWFGLSVGVAAAITLSGCGVFTVLTNPDRQKILRLFRRAEHG